MMLRRGMCLTIRLILTVTMVIIAGRAASSAGTDAPEMRHSRTRAHRPSEQPGKPAQAARAHPTKPLPVEPKDLPPAVSAPPVPKPPTETSPADAANPPPKIPRFAALKTDDTNMRKGPGQRYPIEWVYKRRDLPVEVEREYDVWRFVRDADGVEGWMHQVTLSDRRTFMITDKDATLRADASDTSSAVAILKVGVIGRLRACDQGSKWCQVQAGGYKGYLRRDQFWGLLPDEVISPS